MYLCTVNLNGGVMICTLSSADWQQAWKLQPCGTLNCFGKIEINAPINIVVCVLLLLFFICLNNNNYYHHHHHHYYCYYYYYYYYYYSSSFLFQRLKAPCGTFVWSDGVCTIRAPDGFCTRIPQWQHFSSLTLIPVSTCLETLFLTEATYNPID